MRGWFSTYPGSDLALVPRHQLRDVLLDDRCELGLVPDVVDPAGQLRVPHQGVSTDGLVVGRGPVNEVVGLCEVKPALLVLGLLSKDGNISSWFSYRESGGQKSEVELVHDINIRHNVKLLVGPGKDHSRPTSCCSPGLPGRSYP